MTNKNFRVAFVVAAVGLTGACGSNERGPTTDPTCVAPGDPKCHIDVADQPFVQWTGPATDGVAGGVSSAVVEYTPGRFCMSGKVDPGPEGTGWGAVLVVQLAKTDLSMGAVLAPLDVSALGITQIRFTVDDPPLPGIRPQISALQTAGCTTLPDCLATFNAAAPVLDAGPVTVALTDFAATDPSHPNATFDPTLTAGLQFYVGPLPGIALDYDFCVHDLAFLDASGQEVKP